MSFSIDYLINTTTSTSQMSVQPAKDITITTGNTECSLNTSSEQTFNLMNQSSQKRERIKRSYAESPDFAPKTPTPDKRHRRDYAKGYRTSQRAKVGECQKLKLRIAELRNKIEATNKDLKYAKKLLEKQNSYIEGIIRMNTNLPFTNSNLVRTQ